MLKAYGITDIGRKRKVNQDYVFASQQPIGKLSNLFIVADGMGGHNAGDMHPNTRWRPLLRKRPLWRRQNLRKY